MSLMESFHRGGPVDPAAYVSEPEVTTEPDGTLVISVKVPGLDEGSIVVERDDAGGYEAKADMSEALERHGVETDFAFEFVLPPDTFGEPAWAYTDGVLRITIPLR
jgi:HSP20 family molecular chaperone IbpA